MSSTDFSTFAGWVVDSIGACVAASCPIICGRWSWVKTSTKVWRVFGILAFLRSQGWLDDWMILLRLRFGFEMRSQKGKWWDDWYATHMFRQDMNQQSFAQFRLPGLGDYSQKLRSFSQAHSKRWASLDPSIIPWRWIFSVWTHWWRSITTLTSLYLKRYNNWELLVIANVTNLTLWKSWVKLSSGEWREVCGQSTQSYDPQVWPLRWWLFPARGFVKSFDCVIFRVIIICSGAPPVLAFIILKIMEGSSMTNISNSWEKGLYL